MTAPSPHHSESPRASRTPYAGPSHDAPSRDGERAGHDALAARPYVPVEFRSRPHAADEQDAWRPAVAANIATSVTEMTPELQEESLPWISEFLAAAEQSAAPAAPVAPPVAPTVDSNSEFVAPWAPASEPQSAPESQAHTEPQATEHPAAQAGQGAAGDADRDDEWPFADAGAHASELSNVMPSPDPFGDALLSGATPAALPMWNDDDMMDIMPVRASDDALDREATEAAVQQENSESAARALEALAARVRGGELALPGYASEMGDAAALASALAALLGARH